MKYPNTCRFLRLHEILREIVPRPKRSAGFAVQLEGEEWGCKQVGRQAVVMCTPVRLASRVGRERAMAACATVMILKGWIGWWGTGR